MDEESCRSLGKIVVEGQRRRELAEASGHAGVAGLVEEALEQARAGLQRPDQANSSELETTSASHPPVSGEDAERHVEVVAAIMAPSNERPKRSVLVHTLAVLFFFAFGFVGVVAGLTLLQGTTLRMPY